jgi:hypothetical protein
MRKKISQCTLGDLIVALTDEAKRIGHPRQELYNVVAHALADLFRKQSLYFKGGVFQLVQAMNDETHSRRSH